MRRKYSIALLLALSGALVEIQLRADTIISVDSHNDPAYGYIVIYNGQGYRAGWTQADTYEAVVVSAQLGSGGAAGQTGRAYLTSQIGPGTSTNNEIASTSFTFPLEITNVVLFAGLHLPPGSYYLSIIGDSGSWGSDWKNAGAAEVITGAGVLSLGGFGAAGGLNSYFPATPDYHDLPIPPELAVQGVNVSHPLLQIAQTNGLASISWSTNAVGFALESVNSLSATNWHVIPRAPSTNSGSFVLMTNATGMQFFRLRKPAN
jgi:hypothetical protein